MENSESDASEKSETTPEEVLSDSSEKLVNDSSETIPLENLETDSESKSAEAKVGITHEPSVTPEKVHRYVSHLVS